MSEKPPTESDNLAVHMAFLDTENMAHMERYLRRGRFYKSLSDAEAVDNWKIIFRALSRDPINDSARLAHRDLSAELDLRKIEQPYKDPEIKSCLDLLTKNVSDLINAESAERIEEINADLEADMAKALGKNVARKN